MIISASYKTDIPAFYGEWFMHRVRAGYCKMVNPYGGQVIRVSLAREDVDGFVFWTKNLGPFLKRLAEVSAAGFPFVIQYAINGYPRELEHSVVNARRSVEHVRAVAETYGPRVCVWRYDPIVVSSLTPAVWHLRNFEGIAKGLAGAVDEVVISFAQFYRKTLRNMGQAGREVGFTWEDPALEEKRGMVSKLVEIAGTWGMRVTVCSQRDYVVAGAGEARCVDARRLEDVGGAAVLAKVKGNREQCACHQSRDIGAYDTCPHGCVYCYAVRDRKVAQARFGQHDPKGEFLFATTPNATTEAQRHGGARGVESDEAKERRRVVKAPDVHPGL